MGKSPAAIDILSNHQRSLKDETIDQIKTALLGMKDEEITRLTAKIVQIECNSERKYTPTPSMERVVYIVPDEPEKPAWEICGRCVLI
jgi:hypothetical protein